MPLRMYAFTLLETKASSKTREKSHSIEQLNSPRVKEYINVSKLVPVLDRMSKKFSLALARNSTLKFLKKPKY